MTNLTAPELPPLPLLLWSTPPALEQMLTQEGVPFLTVNDPHALAFAGGRFVLFDGRAVSSRRVRAQLSARHVALDINVLRSESREGDPFADAVDTRASRKSWLVEGALLTERVSRADKAEARRRVIARVREAVTRAGGIWARLAAYPHPYRSAFNFRADLDEPCPDDYFRFAHAREPIDDCSTHFVSMQAYGEDAAVLNDLKRVDTQSHGHYHFIYRDKIANAKNLARADKRMRECGFDPVGFAAPGGRWNAGLDEVLEELGYQYASDFHLGYDDLPFFPWRNGRFSRVLQVPIHPVCEGLFLDAGIDDPGMIARHMIRTLRAKAAAGEPAFLYGHPERRLGRFPEVVTAIAHAAGAIDGLWRVTLTEFASWWRWRAQRKWSLVPKGEGRFSAQFEEWDARYPLALEILKGDHAAMIPLVGPSQMIRPSDLAYARKAARVDPPHPRIARPSLGLRHAIRSAIDWETVTPLDDLPDQGIRDRIKKHLRTWRAPAKGTIGGSR